MHLFSVLPAEAVWVAINTGSYYVTGGIGYINPGATVHCYGYHEWPPFQTSTFTFTNGINSYSAVGYNGTGKGGDFSVYMGPFAPGTNYYMSSSNGGFINGFTGPFTVGYPDSVPPQSPSVSCSGGVNTLTVTLSLGATDNVGVTGCYIVESASVPAAPSGTGGGWLTIGPALNYSGNHSFITTKNAGSKTVHVWFKDAQNNVSARASTTFTITDTIAPNGSFTISQPAGSESGFFKSPNISITLTASDTVSDVTHFFIRNDNSAMPAIGDSNWRSFTASPPQQSVSQAVVYSLSGVDGSKSVYVWYKDATGNIGAASGSPAAITLDTKAPIGGREGTGIWEYVGAPGFTAGLANCVSLSISNGTPYVGYVDASNQIIVKKYSGTVWQSIGGTAGPTAGAYWTSLFVENGVPFIAHEGVSGYQATLLKFNGTVWETLGNFGSTAGYDYSSIYVDNGIPYIAFVNSGSGSSVSVMKYQSGTWHNVGAPGFASVELNSWNCISLKISNGIPFIAVRDYSKGNKVTVMKFNGSAWVNVGSPGFSSDRADFISLDVINSIPYVAYEDFYSNLQKVSVMKFDGSSWNYLGTQSFSDGSGAYTSLSVSSGTPYVAYTDFGNGTKVTVKKFQGTNWVNVGSPGFSAGNAWYDSIGVSEGSIYVAYRDWGYSDGNSASCMKFSETINDGLLINNGAKLTMVPTLKMQIYGTDWRGGIKGSGIEKYCIRYNNSTAPAAGDSTSWLNMPTAFNNTYPATQEVNFVLPAAEPDGLKIFYLWFKDKAGNISSAAQKSIKYDRNPPVEAIAGSLSIVGPHPELLITREVTLQLNAESGQDTIENEGYYDIKVTHYFLADCNPGTTITPPSSSSSWTAVSTPVTPFSEVVFYDITSTGDGTKEIYAWYKDIAGNMSLASKCVTYLDTSIPHGSFTINGGAEWSNSPLVTLNLNALSATAVNGYFISASSTPAPSATDIGWRPVSPPVSNYTANAPYSLSRSAGVKTVYVWYKSTSGIVSAVASDTIKLDCETPVPGFGKYKAFTIAGWGSAGDSDGQGMAARFNHPVGLVFDKIGNLYITDYYNNKIRKMDTSGYVSTFAGPPPGDTSEGTLDGLKTAARLRKPVGITIDSSENLYIGHYQECTIRKITPAGYVSTYAGTSPIVGHDDGYRTSATFYYPIDLECDKFDNLYVCDIGNYTIRKITSTGYVSTIAGTIGQYNEINGTGFNNTQFGIHRITVDSDGNVIGADTGWDKIKKITPGGTVSIIAGPPVGIEEPGFLDGPVTSAKFNYPADVVYDKNQNLYICDQGNNKIRKISAAGIVSTIIDFCGSGITLSPLGQLYVAEPNKNIICKLVPDTSGGLEINNGADFVYTTAVKLNLAATDDYAGVAEYYAAESPEPPNAATTWNSVTLSAGGTAEVNFNLSTITAPVTVYVWFRDAAGNISSYSKKKINPRTMRAEAAIGGSGTFNKPFLIARDSNENLIVADNPAAGVSPLFMLIKPLYSSGARIITPGTAFDRLTNALAGLVVFADNYIGLIETAKKRFAIFNVAAPFISGFAKSVDILSNYHGYGTVADARFHIFDKYDVTGAVNPYAEAAVMGNQITGLPLDLNFAASTVEIFSDSAYTTPIGKMVAAAAPVYLRVKGAGGDPNAVNSIMVSAKSSDDPKGIAVQLVETNSSSDIFTGTLTLGRFSNRAAGVLGAGPKNMIYLSVHSKNGILNGAMQTRPKPPSGPTYIAELGGGVFIEMVRIPAGKFVMGQVDMATPTHEVTISKDFYMSKYEITQGQWLKVMGALASADKPLVSQSNTYSVGKGENYPVYYVSWNDICNSGGNDFMTRINSLGLVDGTFRLPTEAEWEYACRAGTTSTYYWGEDASEATMKQYCWYGPNASSSFPWTNPHAAVRGTQIVGQKLPNAFSLYDMSGNVYEWCSDWFAAYTSAAVTDPTGPAAGSSRASRGGCWYHDASSCRSAYRNAYDPSYRNSFGLGFRLALLPGQ
jgi:formylglycine-generating enzyme required for sulfatase activity